MLMVRVHIEREFTGLGAVGCWAWGEGPEAVCLMLSMDWAVLI